VERSGTDEELQRKVTDLPDPRQGGTPKPSSLFFIHHTHKTGGGLWPAFLYLCHGYF
jgi:hypothetical protein